MQKWVYAVGIVLLLGLVSTTSAEETDLEQVNGMFQDLNNASEHFQTGIYEISGDVNVTNTTTTLTDARSMVEEFIRAFNDLIQIVNRIHRLVSDIQPAPLNISEI